MYVCWELIMMGTRSQVQTGRFGENYLHSIEYEPVLRIFLRGTHTSQARQSPSL